jgi:hypothetical protein
MEGSLPAGSTMGSSLRWIVALGLIAAISCSDQALTVLQGDVDKPHPDSGPRPDSGAPELPANGEVCDGIDNDHNGRIDDADIEADGVCDCLKIATIGASGAWSDNTVFTAWPNSHAQNPVTALGDRKLSDALLAPYQVIIVLDVAAMTGMGNGRMQLANHSFSNAEVAAFERWVRAGGGVMTTIGYRDDETNEVSNVNRLLAPFGMGYSTTKHSVDGYVESWVEHPITTDVHKILTINGVEPDGSAGLTLGKDSGGRTVLQATQARDVRVVVWGDDWITYDSQWQASSDQQVERLWRNILTWLSPLEPCQAANIL